MLYFLLTIIAIGVLLASEAGRNLLGCLIGLGIIAVILFIGFWVVVLIWGFLSEKNTRDTVLTIIGTITVIWAGFYVLYEMHKQGKLTKRAIKTNIARFWKKYFTGRAIKTRATEIWEEYLTGRAIKTKIIETWELSPIWIILWITIFLVIVLSLVNAP